MSSITAPAIAAVYREILNESLTAAAASTPNDPAARYRLERAFDSAIPTTVPSRLSALIGTSALRDALRADAAEILERICLDMSSSRGPFVAAVALAARRRLC
jgi:hypothetical protein